MEQGAVINTTIVEDASGIIGIAGEPVSQLSMEIMDNYSNKFTAANNEILIKLGRSEQWQQCNSLQEQQQKMHSMAIVFDDLVLSRPGTGYRFLIYTEDGEIIQTLTPEFSILGFLVLFRQMILEHILLAKTFPI